MKGLFFLNSNGERIRPVVAEGDTICLEARIYNYSFVEAGANEDIEVSFQYQTSGNGRDWSTEKQLIETTELSAIPAFGNDDDLNNWMYAQVEFYTGNLGGRFCRIWVEADPEDTIEELKGHDNEDTYGNNTGYFGTSLFVKQPSDLLKTPIIPGVNDIALSEISFKTENMKAGSPGYADFTLNAEDQDYEEVNLYVYLKQMDLKNDGASSDSHSYGELIDVEKIPYLPAKREFHARCRLTVSSEKEYW
ncbi:MAG: hypothetical protein U5L07_00300 [Desulfobacterales bacterium]|nr:hypothetical protein [Desulfobacterales bacterium]